LKPTTRKQFWEEAKGRDTLCELKCGHFNRSNETGASVELWFRENRETLLYDHKNPCFTKNKMDTKQNAASVSKLFIG